jgi:hypothetical protein
LFAFKFILGNSCFDIGGILRCFFAVRVNSEKFSATSCSISFRRPCRRGPNHFWCDTKFLPGKDEAQIIFGVIQNFCQSACAASAGGATGQAWRDTDGG